MRDAVLFVRIGEEMKRAVEQAAEDEDLSVAQLMRRIIREWLERRAREARQQQQNLA